MIRHVAPDNRGAGMGQSWVETETSGCDLGDVRLNRRLGAMLEALGDRPGKSLPTAFQDWSNTKAAYRFFSNGNVSEDKILEGHFAASALRIKATEATVFLGWLKIPFSVVFAHGRHDAEQLSGNGNYDDFMGFSCRFHLLGDEFHTWVKPASDQGCLVEDMAQGLPAASDTTLPL